VVEVDDVDVVDDTDRLVVRMMSQRSTGDAITSEGSAAQVL
jgi:hypothetical protein